MNVWVDEGGASRAARGWVSRERVAKMQRARVLDAMAHVAAERGIGSATVSSVLEHDGISRASFYGLFKGLDDCFLALLHDVMSQTTALIIEAFEGERSWSDGVMAGLAALLVFLDAEPTLARVCLIETLAAGSAALEHRAGELKAVEPLVEAGRRHASRNGHLPSLDAEGTVVAVAGILHTPVGRRQGAALHRPAWPADDPSARPASHPAIRRGGDGEGEAAHARAGTQELGAAVGKPR
jgi:AcrR family transcriptional regulator